ncbi:MAG TPA: GTP-binding protein [Burkholderiales bacterium]|jgi:G3E family GTPase
MSRRFPVNLITGAAGAGKTTAILHLLAKRPPDERWAVLINDFGRATLSTASGVSEGKVVLREVAGCICCTAQVAVRTAIVALLREAAPHRLLVEASAAARPASLLHLLREPGLSDAVDVRATVCVVNVAQLRDARYVANELYREQIVAADALYVTTDDATAAGADGARAELQALRSKPAVLFSKGRPFDVALLDRA